MAKTTTTHRTQAFVVFASEVWNARLVKRQRSPLKNFFPFDRLDAVNRKIGAVRLALRKGVSSALAVRSNFCLIRYYSII